MADLQFFNTLTRKKEKFKSLSPQKVLLYTCGPTVYNFAHIGNLRTYIFEDLLRRCLQYFGFAVNQVMNLTDVDDKTIKGANEEHKSLKEYTDKYKKAFFEDLKILNIEKAEHFPEATVYIPQMIKIIEKLLEKKIAYIGADKSVYFSIHKFSSYGKLSHLKLKELKKGASKRVSADNYDKENICDFVLWKAYDPNRDKDLFWESPFGKGRPGWHIECSAMSLSLLGETIDIHCGGVDNIFPHHENEIAQSESFTGKTFVHYWLHSEHLLVNNKKMSKSLNNFYILRDLLEKGYHPYQIRLMLLQTHYRMQLNFTFAGLKGAQQAWLRLKDFVQRLKQIGKKISEKGKLQDIKADKQRADEKQTVKDLNQNSFDDSVELLANAKQRFESGLADDLNISKALAAIFDLVREINILCDQQKIANSQALKILKFLEQADQVLGLDLVKEEKQEIPQKVQDALRERNLARQNKNFQEADRLRDWILDQGFVIEDMPDGSMLKKQSITPP